MNNPEKKWVDENGCYEITDIPPQTLRNKRCAGRGIPYSKIGRSVRYFVPDIHKYMNDRKIQMRG